jgi:hypothetical protein
MNKVYEIIRKDENLREKVKIFGVCPGNNFREIKKFKQEKNVLFPLIPDKSFNAYDAIGDPCGTPFILLVRKGKKHGIITWSHIGLISTPLYFVQEAWDALNTDLAMIAAKAKEKRSMKVFIEKPKPYISDEGIKQKISASMKSLKLTLRDLKKVSIGKERDIFISKVKEEGGQKPYFSKLISRNPVCDLCHAVHFILTFDERGTIVDFVPLHLTKYGNVEWGIWEIHDIRKKLIGKSILNPVPFDPEVDAVSQATMTCALIFNSVERTRRDYTSLQIKGYIKNDALME